MRERYYGNQAPDLSEDDLADVERVAAEIRAGRIHALTKVANEPLRQSNVRYDENSGMVVEESPQIEGVRHDLTPTFSQSPEPVPSSQQEIQKVRWSDKLLDLLRAYDPELSFTDDGRKVVIRGEAYTRGEAMAFLHDKEELKRNAPVLTDEMLRMPTNDPEGDGSIPVPDNSAPLDLKSPTAHEKILLDNEREEAQQHFLHLKRMLEEGGYRNVTLNEEGSITLERIPGTPFIMTLEEAEGIVKNLERIKESKSAQKEEREREKPSVPNLQASEVPKERGKEDTEAFDARPIVLKRLSPRKGENPDDGTVVGGIPAWRDIPGFSDLSHEEQIQVFDVLARIRNLYRDRVASDFAKARSEKYRYTYWLKKLLHRVPFGDSTERDKWQKQEADEQKNRYAASFTFYTDKPETRTLLEAIVRKVHLENGREDPAHSNEKEPTDVALISLLERAVRAPLQESIPATPGEMPADAIPSPEESSSSIDSYFPPTHYDDVETSHNPEDPYFPPTQPSTYDIDVPHESQDNVSTAQETLLSPQERKLKLLHVNGYPDARLNEAGLFILFEGAKPRTFPQLMEYVKSTASAHAGTKPDFAQGITDALASRDVVPPVSDTEQFEYVNAEDGGEAGGAPRLETDTEREIRELLEQTDSPMEETRTLFKLEQVSASERIVALFKELHGVAIDDHKKLPQSLRALLQCFGLTVGEEYRDRKTGEWRMAISDQEGTSDMFTPSEAYNIVREARAEIDAEGNVAQTEATDVPTGTATPPQSEIAMNGDGSPTFSPFGEELPEGSAVGALYREATTGHGEKKKKDIVDIFVSEEGVVTKEDEDALKVYYKTVTRNPDGSITLERKGRSVTVGPHDIPRLLHMNKEAYPRADQPDETYERIDPLVRLRTVEADITFLEKTKSELSYSSPEFRNRFPEFASVYGGKRIGGIHTGNDAGTLMWIEKKLQALRAERYTLEMQEEKVFDRRFELLGITQHDLEQIPSFKELSKGQQMFVYEELRAYSESGPAGALGRAWDMTKRAFGFEAEGTLPRGASGMKHYGDVLALMTMSMRKYGPKVHIENGEARADFIEMRFDREHRKEQKEVADLLNQAAHEFQRIPESWQQDGSGVHSEKESRFVTFMKEKVLRTQSRKNYRAYEAKQRAYEDAKSTFARTLHETGVPNERIVEMLLRVDAQVHGARFIESNPDAAQLVGQIEDRKFWKKAGSVALQGGLYAGVGYSARFALSGLGVLGAPVAAGILAGTRSWNKAAAEQRERDRMLMRGQMSDVDRALQTTRERLADKGEISKVDTTLNVVAAQNEVSGTDLDMGLTGKLERLVEKYEALDPEVGEEERTRLFNQLAARVTYSYDKFRLNRIQFGSGAEYAQNYAHFLRALGRAQVIVGAEEKWGIDRVLTPTSRDQRGRAQGDPRRSTLEYRLNRYMGYKEDALYERRHRAQMRKTLLGGLTAAGTVVTFAYLDEIREGVKTGARGIGSFFGLDWMNEGSGAGRAVAEAVGDVSSPSSSAEAVVERGREFMTDYQPRSGDTLSRIVFGQFPEFEGLRESKEAFRRIADALYALSPEELRSVGVESGNADKISPKNTIDLEALRTLLTEKGLLS